MWTFTSLQHWYVIILRACNQPPLLLYIGWHTMYSMIKMSSLSGSISPNPTGSSSHQPPGASVDQKESSGSHWCSSVKVQVRPGAGGTCIWDTGTQRGPRCPRRPGWRCGPSRGCSRGVHRRGASDGPRTRCSTGSVASLSSGRCCQLESCSPCWLAGSSRVLLKT